MKLMVPDYYPSFRCLADKCRHSCCIGWEIDIDPETRETYRSIPGTLGARLQKGIADGDEGAHFILDGKERCPMLNEKGLCDLICQQGEEMLCQICADHPRFRNFFSDRTEMGLGLCCEGAALLALSQTKPFSLITLEDDGSNEALSEEEAFLLKERDALFAILQDRSLSLAQRLDRLLNALSFSLPSLNWEKVFRSLERLDAAWDSVLDTLKGKDLLREAALLPKHLEIPMEQFTAYLLLRHLPAALEDGDLPGHGAFCVLCAKLLCALCAQLPDCTLEQAADLARMYSAEIEYSNENMDALLDALYQQERT